MRCSRYALDSPPASARTIASDPSAANTRSRAPAAKYIPRAIVPITIAVPRSGSRKMSPVKTAVTMSTPIITPGEVIRSRRAPSQAARYRMSASFANSAGCRPTVPARSHREAPFTFVPMPGTSTAASSAMAKTRSGSDKTR